jgi:hypothetical protein
MAAPREITLPPHESASVAALALGEFKTIRSTVSRRAITIARCRDGTLAAFDLKSAARRLNQRVLKTVL